MYNSEHCMKFKFLHLFLTLYTVIDRYKTYKNNNFFSTLILSYIQYYNRMNENHLISFIGSSFTLKCAVYIYI
jgi:hypothetical protein